MSRTGTLIYYKIGTFKNCKRINIGSNILLRYKQGNTACHENILLALYNLQVCDALSNVTHLFKQQQKRLCFKT